MRRTTTTRMARSDGNAATPDVDAAVASARAKWRDALPKPVQGILNILEMSGIVVTQAAVPFVIVFSIIVPVASYFYNELADHSKQLSAQINDLRVANGNTQDTLEKLISVLSKHPEGFWIQNISFGQARKSRTVRLPINYSYRVSMMILVDDDVRDEFENALVFRINNKVAPEYKSEHIPSWMKTTPFFYREPNEFPEALTELFSKQSDFQEFEFRMKGDFTPPEHEALMSETVSLLIAVNRAMPEVQRREENVPD